MGGAWVGLRAELHVCLSKNSSDTKLFRVYLFTAFTIKRPRALAALASLGLLMMKTVTHILVNYYIQGSIHRYLQDTAYKANFLKYDVSKHRRDVIASKITLLKVQGNTDQILSLMKTSFFYDKRVFWDLVSINTAELQIHYRAVTCFRRSPIFDDNIEMPLISFTFSLSVVHS